MDLLSSIRKEGSRGGVDFKWSDVSTSQHRENYLGHSIMAPVGRWQKNKDLSWYAKADSSSTTPKNGAGDVTEESAEERRVRERKEEIRRIKEAEEDALARALGLPVAERAGPGSGANAIDLKEMRKVIQETEEGDEEIEEVGRAGRFGEFVGRAGVVDVERAEEEGVDTEAGGLIGGGQIALQPSKSSKRPENGREERDHSRDRKPRHHHRHRNRSRNRSRSREGDRHRPRQGENRSRERRRSRTPSRKERRPRSRSDDRNRRRREDRGSERERRRDPESRHRDRRSRSPDFREQDRRRERERGGHRRR